MLTKHLFFILFFSIFICNQSSDRYDVGSRDCEGSGPVAASPFLTYIAFYKCKEDLVWWTLYASWCLLVQETYPTTPPVWFADSEDPIVTNAVTILVNTQGRDNHVINQVCCLFDIIE